MKLRKKTRNIFYAIFYALFATGVLAWFFDRWVRVRGAFGEEHHPLQSWISRAHAVAAYGILVIFGYLLHSHVRPGLKAGKSVRTGVSMITALVVLALTSLPILYAADGAVRNGSTWIHTYLGLSIPLILILHLSMRGEGA